MLYKFFQEVLEIVHLSMLPNLKELQILNDAVRVAEVRFRPVLQGFS